MSKLKLPKLKRLWTVEYSIKHFERKVIAPFQLVSDKNPASSSRQWVKEFFSESLKKIERRRWCHYCKRNWWEFYVKSLGSLEVFEREYFVISVARKTATENIELILGLHKGQKDFGNLNVNFSRNLREFSLMHFWQFVRVTHSVEKREILSPKKNFVELTL